MITLPDRPNEFKYTCVAQENWCHTCRYMYVCMYVYVCVYICMYVCMYDYENV